MAEEGWNQSICVGTGELSDLDLR